MKDIVISSDSLETDFVNFLRELFKDYVDKNKVTLNVDGPNENHPGTIINIIPNNVASACIEVFCENGDSTVYLTLGKGTQVEIMINHKQNLNYNAEKYIEKLMRAVFNGNFKETVWTKKTEIVKAVGIVVIDGQDITYNSYSALSNPFKQSTKEEYLYNSY